VASSIVKPPHNKNTISVPTNGIDAIKLVITIAAQKLI
jgi:DNA-binding transcriptional regulator LsrR (DeoR family)